MEEKKIPGPQDDKRFIRDEDEKIKDDKKRIPIQLPEIDYPLQKGPPPVESLKKEPIKPKLAHQGVSFEKLKDTTKFESENIQPIKAQRNGIPRTTTKPVARISRVALFLIYILTLFLCTSIFVNVFFYYNISDLKQNISTNTQAVEQMFVEKEKTLKESKTLNDEINKLKGEIAAAVSGAEGLKRRNKELEAEVAKAEAKYKELERKTKDYAKELRGLASKKIGYYDAYKKEKEAAEKLTFTVKDLQNEIDTLKTEMSSLHTKYKEREANLVYNMAFIYVKAGMYDEAIQSFKNFMSLSGENADVYYNLGFIYEHIKKDRDKALTNYYKYLKLKPDADDLYEVKMKIASLQRAGAEKRKDHAKAKQFKIKLGELKY